MVKKITISRLRVGDILAESVVEGANRILLREGTVLSESQVEMLRNRGVAIVTIQNKDDEGKQEDAPRGKATPEDVKKILIEESGWFGEVRKGPIMSEVFRHVVNRRTKELTGVSE